MLTRKWPEVRFSFRIGVIRTEYRENRVRKLGTARFHFGLVGVHAAVATCGDNCRMEAGIRDLKDNLSRYIRRIEAGEHVVVTAHGRVVAELVPPGEAGRSERSPFDRLVASGTITPPAEDGDPLEGCPEIRLPRGTATALIDSDRDEAKGSSAGPRPPVGPHGCRRDGCPFHPLHRIECLGCGIAGGRCLRESLNPGAGTARHVRSHSCRNEPRAASRSPLGKDHRAAATSSTAHASAVRPAFSYRERH